jgi:predicted nucleic acid-binding protein
VNDAYLAAFAIAGDMRFATFDTGFRQFSELDLILLKP